MDKPDFDLAGLIQRSRDGDRAATDQLYELLYPKIREIASGVMRRQGPDHTLQPTLLANDAFLGLFLRSGVDVKNETHLLRLAALCMRQNLIDYARMRGAQRRGGGALFVLVDPELLPGVPPEVNAQDLGEALAELEQINPQASQVTSMRFFSGLGYREIAGELGVSEDIVRGHWKFARAFLQRFLSHGGKSN